MTSFYCIWKLNITSNIPLQFTQKYWPKTVLLVCQHFYVHEYRYRQYYSRNSSSSDYRYVVYNYTQCRHVSCYKLNDPFMNKPTEPSALSLVAKFTRNLAHLVRCCKKITQFSSAVEKFTYTIKSLHKYSPKKRKKSEKISQLQHAIMRPSN